MKVLDIKISEASRNVKANTRLNESPEKKIDLIVDIKNTEVYTDTKWLEFILNQIITFWYANTVIFDK